MSSNTHSADDFKELLQKTGMKKKVLAEICGKHPATFSRYLAGTTPVPEAVWKLVETRIESKRVDN